MMFRRINIQTLLLMILAFSLGLWVNVNQHSPSVEAVVIKKSEDFTSNKVAGPGVEKTSQRAKNALEKDPLSQVPDVEIEGVTGLDDVLLNEDGTLTLLPKTPISISDDAERRVRKYLQFLHKKLRAAEKLRAHVEVKELEKYSLGRVVISSPSVGEVASFREIVESTARALPEDVRDYYRVDALRMLDLYLFFKWPYLVLFVQEYDPIPNEFHAHRGQLWEYYTEQPELFQISPEGTLSIPPKMVTSTNKAWLENELPAERYRHLFPR